ncbi:hypothetical protein V498_02345 [Pseudogymnoascus sp. VKM F-4517 (FW-2822)]|nr:hypothetical protein V498_02345 [Pseudogymnoascus sp. VKM F-4517 (FW-2822)]
MAMGISRPTEIDVHNGWPGRSSDSHPPGTPTLPVCRDWSGGNHVVLLNVQSEARRTCIIGLEASLGPLNVEDIQRVEWGAYDAWARTDSHVASFDSVQIIQVKWNTDQTDIISIDVKPVRTYRLPGAVLTAYLVTVHLFWFSERASHGLWPIGTTLTTRDIGFCQS